MKSPILLCAALVSASAVFAAVPDANGVLTITGGKMSELTEEVAAITGGQVTKIVKTGGGGLDLDVDLSAYTGSWDIQQGRVYIKRATGALGSYGDGTDEVLVSSASAQLCIPSDPMNNIPVTIDKKVRFSASSSNSNDAGAMLSIVNHTSNNTFTRLVTMEGAYFAFFGAGGFTCAGGLQAPNTTIYNQGASYSVIIRNVPCDIKCVVPTYHNYQFEVSGNRLGKFDFSNAGSHLRITCDNPFAEDGAPSIYGNSGTASDHTFSINGFSVKIGNYCITNKVTLSISNQNGYSGTANLTVSNTTDSVLNANIAVPCNLVKEGAGKLTIRSTPAGSLTVRDGAAVVPSNVTWNNCTGVTLDGGSLELSAMESLPPVPLVVTDATRAGQLKLNKGFDYSFPSLTTNGAVAAFGLYGGAAADLPAERQFAWFDDEGDGRLSIDNTLVITASGDFSAVVSNEDVAKLLDNTYTRVVVKASVNLDTALPTYRGGWYIQAGTTKVVNAAGLGCYGDGAEVAVVGSSTQLYVCGGDIDKPIHFHTAYNSTRQLYMSSTTTYFKRKVTVEKALSIFFGGSGTIYCDGGFEHKSGTITDAGASGSWYIRNVPAQINEVDLTWQPLKLQVAGNAIRKVTLSVGGRLFLETDDALSGYPTVFASATNERFDSSYFQLNGHDATIGGINFTYAMPIHAGTGGARLTVSNATDVTFPVAHGSSRTDGALTIVKAGAGKLTLSGACDSSGALEVKEGTFAFAANARWDNCPSVTLEGGRLELASAENLPLGVNVVVASAAEQVVDVADDVNVEVSGLSVGGVAQDRGSYGGAASSAATKLACFDGTDTGTLIVHSVGYFDLAENRALTEDEKNDLVTNRYSLVRKTGGTLTLDSSLEGFVGKWDIQSGQVKVTTHDHAFGSDSADPAQAVLFNYANSACIYMQEGTANRPLVFTGTSPQNNGNVFFIYSGGGTSNAFEQAILVKDAAGCILYSGSKTVLKGGLTALAAITAQTAGNSLYIQNKPVDMVSFTIPWTTIHFQVPGNRIGTFTIHAGSGVNIECDNPFTEDTNIVMDHSDQTNAQMVLNLRGHDLTCGTLTLYDKAKIFATNEGNAASPATPVTLNFAVNSGTNTFPKAGVTMNGTFSVVKRGAGALAITNSVFTGRSLTVADGKLIYRGDAPETWKLTNLVVSATATLALDAGKVFRAQEFVLGGVAQKPGIYAGPACPDARKKVLSCFDAEGAGYVFVPGMGTVLVFR